MAQAGINYNQGRAATDQYHTPPKEIAALMPLIWADVQAATSILEPSAGTGRVAAVLAEMGVDMRKLTEVELNPALALAWPRLGSRQVIANTLSLNPADFAADLIIGNPPYVLALEFVLWCLEALTPNGKLYFLLRSGFTSGVKRYEKLFKSHPATSHYLVRRPSFVHKISGYGKDGEPRITKHDQFSHAWICIQKNGAAGACSWLDNRPDEIRKALAAKNIPIPEKQLAPYFPGLIDENGVLLKKSGFSG